MQTTNSYELTKFERFPDAQSGSAMVSARMQTTTSSWDKPPVRPCARYGSYSITSTSIVGYFTSSLGNLKKIMQKKTKTVQLSSFSGWLPQHALDCRGCMRRWRKRQVSGRSAWVLPIYLICSCAAWNAKADNPFCLSTTMAASSKFIYCCRTCAAEIVSINYGTIAGRDYGRMHL